MIDYAFIQKLEGNSNKGYVPDLEHSNSGVTIASGFDLGARRLSDLIGLPKPIIDKFTPYLGIKGADAQAKLESCPLILSDEECAKVNKFAHQEAEERLLDMWDGETPFNDLSDRKQTVVASVSFQYGHLPSRTPNFWQQVTSGEWDAAIKNLRNFGDRYPTRRNKEADYLEGKV
ncbi:MAG: pesticin C-terminus-like muramidase [Pseudomonadota bacterium]|nr:pesticin C-terminus-like muramidase [Pseudomonadota bacterium]